MKFLILFLLFGCAVNPDSLEEELIKAKNINSEKWTIKNIQIENIKPEKCPIYTVDFDVVAKKDCFDLRHEYTSNSFINLVMKVFSKNEDVFNGDNCIGLDEMDKDIKLQAEKYAEKLNEEYCLEYTGMRLGSNCARKKVITEQDIDTYRDNLLMRYKKQLEDLDRKKLRLKKGRPIKVEGFQIEKCD